MRQSNVKAQNIVDFAYIARINGCIALGCMVGLRH